MDDEEMPWIEWNGERFYVSALRVLVHPERKLLLLADPHIGKAAHFRKNGIPAPQGADRAVLERLEEACSAFEPERVIVLGDLAHSTRNKEWDRFLEWREQRPSLSFELVRGNHDILPQRHYDEGRVRLLEPGHEEAPFRFFHDPVSALDAEKYAFAGHLHPGCRVGHRNKERFTLPCFWFGPGGALLPAFNPFAGTARIEAEASDPVYLLAEDSVVPWLPSEEGKSPKRSRNTFSRVEKISFSFGPTSKG